MASGGGGGDSEAIPPLRKRGAGGAGGASSGGGAGEGEGGGVYECNICLETASDPVVTLWVLRADNGIAGTSLEIKPTLVQSHTSSEGTLELPLTLHPDSLW